jgi:glycosyltransferase involved in cell wall biosynthesis
MNIKQAKHVKLLYLTYNENVLESGILRSQVREMLEEITRQPGIVKVRLLSFISPPLWFRQRKGYARLVHELRSKNIDFRVRLMPAAQAWKWYCVPLFMVFCLPVLLSHILCSGFDIIHARGYAAGLLAMVSAKLTSVKFVFDPRGWYADEMVLNKTWASEGFTYRMWKWLELRLIRNCDAVVALTPRFKQNFIELGAKKAIFAPSRLNVRRFNEPAMKVERYNQDLLFIGQMDADWNSPARVAKHFISMQKIIPNLKLRLITPKCSDYVRKVLDENGVARSDWSIESARPEEMPVRMSGSGLGLAMAYRPSGNWPMKFGEYLAAGVPVVVEKQIGEHITGPVRRWRLGAVIDEDDPDSYHAVDGILRDRAGYSERCLRYARLKLDISHTAKQYAKLYRAMLKR